MLGDNITQHSQLPAERLPEAHELPRASCQQGLQPWQARLAGHAEGIQQLDRDSLCRLSDPCQQPSKRARSCPPDSFGAEPHQPAGSTDAMQEDDPISDGDDAMSAGDSGSSGEPEVVLAPDAQGRQQQPADAVVVPIASTGAIGWSKSSHMAVAQIAQPHDSLDMTQPNLTPAAQRQSQQPGAVQEIDSDPRTAPIRAFPSTSPHRSSVDLDPDLDCDMLLAAEPVHRPHHPQPKAAVANQPGPNHSPLQQHGMYRQTSAPPRVSQVKPAKWRQRGGQRAAAFAENDQPAPASAAVPGQQDEQVQQCWLQAGAGAAVGRGEVPAVLGESAQRARVGGEFKYQEVVRGKADRAALQVIRRSVLAPTAVSQAALTCSSPSCHMSTVIASLYVACRRGGMTSAN